VSEKGVPVEKRKEGVGHQATNDHCFLGGRGENKKKTERRKKKREMVVQKKKAITGPV